jgi:transposase-like protein
MNVHPTQIKCICKPKDRHSGSHTESEDFENTDIQGSKGNECMSVKKTRRSFTAEYKIQILEKADLCVNSNEVEMLLHQEGLYAANLSLWRRLRDRGLLNAMRPKKRGRKPSKMSSLEGSIAKLEKENLVLHQKLKQAEIIIAAQKKVQEILEYYRHKTAIIEK